MKKIFVFVLGLFVVSGSGFAQNTQREPLGGGTTNPVTPTEMHGANIDPERSTDAAPKKKPKGTVTATPATSTPSKPATEPKPEATETTK